MKRSALLIASRDRRLKVKVRRQPQYLYVGQRLRDWYELCDDGCKPLGIMTYDNIEIVRLSAVVLYLEGSSCPHMIGKTEEIHIDLSRCEIL